MSLFDRLHYDIVRYQLVPMIYGEMWYDIHRELRVRIGLKKPFVTPHDCLKMISELKHYKVFQYYLHHNSIFQYMVYAQKIDVNDMFVFMCVNVYNKYNSTYCDKCDSLFVQLDFVSFWLNYDDFTPYICYKCTKTKRNRRKSSDINVYKDGVVATISNTNRYMWRHAIWKLLNATYNNNKHYKAMKLFIKFDIDDEPLDELKHTCKLYNIEFEQKLKPHRSARV